MQDTRKARPGKTYIRLGELGEIEMPTKEILGYECVMNEKKEWRMGRRESKRSLKPPHFRSIPCSFLLERKWP
jgi:hypothetical protein